MHNTHIARHAVADAQVAAAVGNFASRIGRQVDLMQHSEGRDPFGWELIADEFLDYAGALSLTDPDLRSNDAHQALRAAADAARGVVTLGVYQWEPVHVFIEYVNFGLTYRPAEDPAMDLSAQDWLRALHLAVICGRYEAEAATFGETAQALAVAADAPLGRRAAADLAFGLLAYVRDYDLDEGDGYDGEPLNRAEAAARLDALLAESTGPEAWRVPELTATRALLTGDREAFRDGLAGMLARHHEVHARGTASPRSLLPLGAIALAALATRREGWEPGIESAYLPATLVTGRRTPAPASAPTAGTRTRPPPPSTRRAVP
ncbi:Imm49 family immunity protein [Streptomyces stramineus]